MGFEAYTRDDSGREQLALTPEEWQGWVSASRTRNWCLKDPLLDWLARYGEAHGFERDPEPDPRTDFQAFIFRQGHAFEAAVVAHLATLAPVCRMGDGVERLSSLDACEATFGAMQRGEPIIHQGILWNPANRTYGAADLLVRSDALRELFPEAISEEDAEVGAPGLGSSRWHYRVVDIKFSGLHFDRHWHAANGHLPFMVQTFLYNEALGRIQGYLPPLSYLLGRGWAKGAKDGASTSCMDRLAPVAQDHDIQGVPLRQTAAEAVAWIRRMRAEGSTWDPRANPVMPELRPNPGNQNYPWHGAVARLAKERNDVTLAWQVGGPGRELALAAGITEWSDPCFSAAAAGVSGTYAAVLDRMLEVNRDPNGPVVVPDRIRVETETWGRAAGVEFYVDFETVSNLNDDFTRIPEQNGQALIFMIGCGHIENGEWRFSCFIADDLSVASEAAVIESWLGHMEEVRARLAPEVERPLVFHWSPAETSTLSTALDSARSRSPERSAGWREPNWFDFLNRVMKREPVIVRGPMGFGLKTVARALKEHGLITTEWGDSVTDGLGAMMAAWHCAAEAKRTGARLTDSALMGEVRAYNEVDCKVMMEAVAALRVRC